MLQKYIEAIETVNWLVWQTPPGCFEENAPAQTVEELKSIKARLVYLFDDEKAIKTN